MNSTVNENIIKLSDDLKAYCKTGFRKSDTQSLAQAVKEVRELQFRAAQLGETPILLAGVNRHLRMAYQMSKLDKQDKVADSVMEAAVLIIEASETLLDWITDNS